MSAVLSEEKPDLVLLLQGRIENALVPMLAAHRAGIPIVSYIPMAHATAELGYRFGTPVLPRILDGIRSYYYRLPRGYAVPSAAVERQLRSHGVTARIDVVPTWSGAVRPTLACRCPGEAPDRARRAPGRLCRTDRPASKGIGIFLWTPWPGRGPTPRPGGSPSWGMARTRRGLRTALDAAGLLPRSRLISWTDTPGDWYAASDVVMMPSRFEGVPLTMMEALLHERPVLGSEIDVFLDYLPRDG